MTIAGSKSLKRFQGLKEKGCSSPQGGSYCIQFIPMHLEDLLAGLRGIKKNGIELRMLVFCFVLQANMPCGLLMRDLCAMEFFSIKKFPCLQVSSVKGGFTSLFIRGSTDEETCI